MAQPMVYTVISFDFGGSSNAIIHTVTEQRELAESVYTTVEAQARTEDAKSGAGKMLVELTCVPKDSWLHQGATLFWGEHAIMNNNS